MDQSTLNPLQRFWLLLKPDRNEIKNIYIYAFFLGLVNLSLPIGIQTIINLIQGGRMSTSWIVPVCFVIIGIAISGLLQINQLKITEHLQQKIFARAAFEFAYRIPKIKLEAMYKHYAPELMNRFFDVVSIQKSLSKILIDFSTASIQTFFGLLLLSLYHPFFIIFSLILIILVFTIFKLTYRNGLNSSLKESKSKYSVAHWLEEIARTNVSFKLAGLTDLPLEKTNKSVDHYIEARDQHFTVLKNQFRLMVIFKVLVAAGLLIVGSLLVMDQQMNIGQFVAAELIIILVLNSVEKLILSLEAIYDVLTSLEKVGQVTDLELEVNEGLELNSIILPQSKGLEISVNEISFSYPYQNDLIFENASLNIKSGERILVKGDSDSGKSTLLYLLAGLYKIQKGSISYNGLPISNLNPNHLRSEIGDCLMDEMLFEGTVYENITMGRKSATLENVQWAIDQLELSEFIKSLPNGYNTIIESHGKHYSKGIIDKLVLARSIVDKPKLLLVKDAFASIDKKTREHIMNFLTSRENNWTLIVASKDSLWEQKVDRIILAEQGILTEQ